MNEAHTRISRGRVEETERSVTKRNVGGYVDEHKCTCLNISILAEIMTKRAAFIDEFVINSIVRES